MRKSKKVQYVCRLTLYNEVSTLFIEEKSNRISLATSYLRKNCPNNEVKIEGNDFIVMTSSGKESGIKITISNNEEVPAVYLYLTEDNLPFTTEEIKEHTRAKLVTIGIHGALLTDNILL